MRVRVLFAFALSLAVSCGGKTNSSLDDEPAAGGVAGENGGSSGVSGAGGVTGGSGPATGGSAGSARGGSAGSAAGGDAGTATGGSATGGTACALEAAALWDFKTRNDACDVDDDCVTEAVGCDVTEDDCTGAVYFAHDFDREEFTQLRDEYYACVGMCGACRRAMSPPACVSGHCVIRPLR